MKKTFPHARNFHSRLKFSFSVWKFHSRLNISIPGPAFLRPERGPEWKFHSRLKNVIPYWKLDFFNIASWDLIFSVQRDLNEVSPCKRACAGKRGGGHLAPRCQPVRRTGAKTRVSTTVKVIGERVEWGTQSLTLSLAERTIADRTCVRCDIGHARIARRHKEYIQVPHKTIMNLIFSILGPSGGRCWPKPRKSGTRKNALRNLSTLTN